jgi:glycosyltransferase involved in cell wall biosynthesis
LSDVVAGRKGIPLEQPSSLPLVTFVVPCYKYAHFLGKCVNSILAQSFKNLEILIMDNCSPDDTQEVAQSFQDPRVRYFRNDSNIGQVQNFNKGLTLARGKYVWVLSADDLLGSPSVVERYVEVMEQDAKLGFVFCRAIELLGDKERGIVAWADYGDQNCRWHDSTFFLRLTKSCCIVLSSVMIRMECLNRVGFFPTDLRFADDWYLLGMLAMHFGGIYFAEPMVFCRIHEESLTSQQNEQYAHVCIGDEVSVLWRLGIQAELESKPHLRDACRSALICRAKEYLKAGLLGTSPRMNAAELDEILESRIQDSNSLRRIRTDVYNSLARDIRSVYYADGRIIGVADEVGAFSDLCQRAALANIHSLCDACKRALAYRLSCRLREDMVKKNLVLSGAEFADVLRSRIPDDNEAKDIQALIYSELGDQQFSHGEHAQAASSYRLALQIRPGHPVISAKYLLMQMGTPGIWIRQVSHQVRGAGRRT